MVGTLGVAGYLEAAEQVRKLAHAAGKKTYTLLMGKPSPVKLANFPEIDIFVLIADAQVSGRINNLPVDLFKLNSDVVTMVPDSCCWLPVLVI